MALRSFGPRPDSATGESTTCTGPSTTGCTGGSGPRRSSGATRERTLPHRVSEPGSARDGLRAAVPQRCLRHATVPLDLLSGYVKRAGKARRTRDVLGGLGRRRAETEPFHFPIALLTRDGYQRYGRMRRHLGIVIFVVTSFLLSTVASASTTSAPTAITGPVKALGTSTATVTGSVNPNGQATSRYFEYGTSTSYGSKTASAAVGSGTGNVDVSAALTGLAPGTTYHYRVVATNGAGTRRGADGIFVTAVAPGVVTGAATNVTPTSATLNGTVDPNGRSTTYFFEYGTGTSYGSKTPVKSAGSGMSSSNVSTAVSGLVRGKRYHFRLVVTSDAGVSRGADQTFSTFGAPTVATGAANSIAPTSARLTGTVTPNGQATSWFFEYGTTSSHGSKTAARSAGSGTSAVHVSASLTRLKPGTTYHYRLVATNGSGTRPGSDQTFTTIGPPLVMTGAPQGVGPNSATVDGSVDPLGRATTWYVEYGTSASYGSRTSTMSAGSRAGAHIVSVSLFGLTPSTTYHYRLVAKSVAGTRSGADVAFTTTGVTLTLPAQRVVYGLAVSLSGNVPTNRAG